MKAKLQEMTIPLLRWYNENKRDLPWRKDHDFYHIWISEIMLQQTRVEAAIGYYNRFLQELPTIKDLAECPEEKLLKLWEGLGYYSRARNLQKAAKQIVKEGIPTNKESLLKLPGIGPYTSSAIASICFQETTSAVDGNFLRILSRITMDASDIKENSTKEKYAKILDNIISRENPGDFNQAMMDLGATICLPNGMPKCEQCPIFFLCKAHQKGKELAYPVKKKKMTRKIIEKTIFVIEQDGKIALHKRPENGLLASLYEFPNIDTYLSDIDLENELYDRNITYYGLQVLPEAKHIFTHLEWHMKGFYFETKDWEEENIIWVTKEELFSKYSIPSALKKYVDWLEKVL